MDRRHIDCRSAITRHADNLAHQILSTPHQPSTPYWLSLMSFTTIFNSVLKNQSGEQMHQTNSLSPNRMTSDQRRVEIAALIAKAIIRLKAPVTDSQILVDKTAQRSVHGTTPDDHQQENI